MDYVRKKGASRGTGSGKEAAATFRRAWREATGDGGEQIGDVSRDYGVSRGGVTAIAEPYQDLGEGEGGKSYHRSLLAAGFKHVRSDEGEAHYAHPAGHSVRVKGGQARLRTAEGKTHYADTLDELEALLPRKRESVRAFWRTYLRD